MGIAIYFLYAFVQAILVARYPFKDSARDAPVLSVIFLFILAPVVSAGVILHYSEAAIRWLVTYKR